MTRHPIHPSWLPHGAKSISRAFWLESVHAPQLLAQLGPGSVCGVPTEVFRHQEMGSGGTAAGTAVLLRGRSRGASSGAENLALGFVTFCCEFESGPISINTVNKTHMFRQAKPPFH